MRIGGWGRLIAWGELRVRSSLAWVPVKGPSSPLHICRQILSASSSSSNLSAIGGKLSPRPRDSSSFQAAPIPSMARPAERTSRVVTALASRPGWRYTTPVTRVSSLTRAVCAARYPRVV